MKHILLPTDFSEASYNAMEYAVQLFKNDACTFYVVNTYTPVALYTTTVYENQSALNLDIGEIYKKTSQQNVQKAIDRMTTTHANPKHTFKGISSFNSLSVEVKELTTEYPIDCIIMGTNGASGLKEVFIGSQTMHVIKESSVAVIGVPVGYSYREPKDILFATDYNIDTKQKGLALLESICSSHTSRLVFLNGYYGVELDKEQLANKEALDTYFKRDAHINEVIDGMDVLEAIEHFQSRHRIDLLALVRNEHNFFENLLFTPVVRKVVHHSHVPFYILPPHKI